jgi:fructose/tagatose bisphosphate aldolase
MLISGHDLLDVAHKNNFAIPAFNVADYHMFNGLIEISEEKNSPVIIATCCARSVSACIARPSRPRSIGITARRQSR